MTEMRALGMMSPFEVNVVIGVGVGCVVLAALIGYILYRLIRRS